MLICGLYLFYVIVSFPHYTCIHLGDSEERPKLQNLHW